MDGDKIQVGMNQEDFETVVKQISMNLNNYIVGNNYVINKKEIKYIQVLEEDNAEKVDEVKVRGTRNSTKKE